MKLIIGLGNPGSKYANTRHNTGFRAVDVLAGNTKWQADKKFSSQIVELKKNGAKIILAKPQTFMNESGRAARLLIDYYKIPLADILVIGDDLDLLLGQTRLRASGSAGGHNGLASIIAHLGTEHFARLRIGIAEEKTGKQDLLSEDYVLRPFSKGGEAIIKKSLATLPEILGGWLA